MTLKFKAAGVAGSAPTNDVGTKPAPPRSRIAARAGHLKSCDSPGE